MPALRLKSIFWQHLARPESNEPADQTYEQIVTLITRFISGTTNGNTAVTRGSSSPGKPYRRRPANSLPDACRCHPAVAIVAVGNMPRGDTGHFMQ
jgi:hypothetical protein